MVSFSAATISAAALLALVQYTPAPFAAIPIIVSIDLGTAAAWVGAAGGITGGVAGAVSAANSAKKGSKRRDVDAPFMSRIKRADAANEAEFGSQLAWQECHTDLKKATIGFKDAGPGNLLVTGMPATCMTLSTVITGKFDEGNPIPMGSDSMQFNNLSDETLTEIENALKARS